MKSKKDKRVLTAKIHAGYPAKKYFQPLMERSDTNAKDYALVWPTKGSDAFCIVQGQKYIVNEKYQGTGEIFELDEIDLDRIRKEEEAKKPKVEKGKRCQSIE